MKRFTFTLMVLLILLGGVSIQAETVDLPIKGGEAWSAWTEGYQKGTDWSSGKPAATDQFSGTVKINDGRPKFARLGGKGWSSSYNGQKQTFTMVLNNSIKNPNNNDVSAYTKFVLVAIKGGTYKLSGDTNDLDDSNNNWDYNNQFKDGNGSNETKIVANSGVLTPTFVNNEATIQLEVNEDYDAVYFYTPDGDGGDKAINIVSFTLTIGGGGTTVAAPTISPASSTYDGDLSVTITKGDGNAKVVYSVSGATTGIVNNEEFTGSSKVLNLTGTGTITVSATGYDNANHASTTTECEYTYSVPNGKTNVAYAIPHVVNTAKYTYTFEGGDNNVSTTGFSNTNNSSTDEHYQSSKNLWLKNDVKNDYSKVNAWDSQVYINLNSSEWPVGTKAILHFAMKSSTGFDAHGEKMEIAFQQNSNENYKTCGIFSTGMVPTDKWEEYDLETTVTGDAKCEKLYFNCGKFSGEFRFDDIILYKVEEEAATGGDTHFTTDDQVANIASTEFSGLNEGDYICADVTGNPETIKLTCNGKDYPLTKFNGSTLWGIMATAAMVTALQNNNSQFKGHDLTLKGIDIYKTVALGEGDNSTALASKINNVFVELTRNFTGGTWNTVCLPFVPTPAQATELFGSGYKLAKFTASGTDKMTFTTIDLNNEDFVAGKPYLVYPTANLSHSNKVLANVSITKTEGSEDGDNEDKGYKFKGSFEPTTFSSNLSRYRFIASGNELKTPTESTLKSLRCYFEYPSGGNARSFTIDEKGGTTGINAVNGEGFMVNGYYNLNGQRVAQPTKGLYIVNGKKVVIK